MLLAPRLLPLHLLGLVATTVFVLLGNWQFESRQAERAASVRDLSDLPPVPLDGVLGADDPFPSAAVGRPVELSGTWVPEATFLTPGREHGGEDGYWVLTPIAVCEEPDACATASALLVVRGWTADPAQAPEAPEGPVELTGWLQPPEGTGVRDEDPTDDVLPEIRIADAIQRADRDLYGAYLIADQADPPAATTGLEPVTPASLPEPASGVGLRNLLYGVQWWVFAAFAVYVWWRWARDEVERGRRSRTASDEPAPAAGADG